jgi:hypothetical protein
MADTTPTDALPQLLVRQAMAIPVFAEDDVEDGEDDPLGKTPVEREDWRMSDPYSFLAESATAWVDVKLPPDNQDFRVDLPHKEPEELYELVETLYLLYGWRTVDEVCERVERALVASVVEILQLPNDELNAIAHLAFSSGLAYIPPDHLDLSAKAIGALIVVAQTRKWPGVIAGLRALVPLNDLFSSRSPRAQTQAIASSNPEVSARLYADVLVALEKARRQVAARVMSVLRRTEREAMRMFWGTINDSRAEVCRETIRYFTLQKESVAAALSTLESMRVTTDEKGVHGEKCPAAKQPRGLQEALKKLKPFAAEVLRIDRLSRGVPSTEKFVEAALQRARSAFAREVGRHAQEFPVLSQFAEDRVRPAAEGGPDRLGEIVFPLLARAYTANRKMQSRAKHFKSAVGSLADSRHPEKDLAAAVKRLGKDATIWGYLKYVRRAMARAAALDEIAQKTVKDALTELESQTGDVAKELAQAAGELMIMGGASRFATKFVPVLNVALAAWHISTAVTDFADRHDEFYCALDPRDALIEAAPSAAGLALNIASEAAFAFV